MATATGLDPKTYNVAEYEKAVDAYNRHFKKRAKQGQPPRDPFPQPESFLLEGVAGPKTGKVGSYDPRFGGIPGVPDPTVSAGDAIKGNLTNFGDLAALTGKTNELLFDQYTGRMPGYSDIADTSSANILSNLRGELPPDVLNLIGQQAAERGISAGVSGSQFSNSDYLRSLGLTSLDLKGRGETGFSGAMDRLKGIPTFDPATMFTNPEDVYNADLQRNIFSSMPVPSAENAWNAAQAALPFQEAENRRRQDEWAKNRTVPWINPTFTKTVS